MKCDNCGTEEDVKDTELGELCYPCYQVLLFEHLDIIEENYN